MKFLLFRARFHDRTLNICTRKEGDLNIYLNATTRWKGVSEPEK